MNETAQFPAQRSLEELGARLKSLRESQSLSLEDIAGRTHIRKNFLENIERGDFSGFKALVYARGFVRTITELLDAPELWQEYNGLLTFDAFEEMKEAQRKSAPEPSVQVVPAARIPSPSSSSRTSPRGFRHSSLRRNCLILLCVILAAAGAALLMNWDRIRSEVSWLQQEQAYTGMMNRENEQAQHEEQRLAEEAAAREQFAAAQAEQQEALAPAEPEPEPEPAPAPVEEVRPVLTLRASGACWLRVTRGSTRVTERTVSAGWEETFDLNSAVTIRLGAGQNVVWSTNGSDFQTFARGISTWTFSPDGTAQRQR